MRLILITKEPMNDEIDDEPFELGALTVYTLHSKRGRGQALVIP
jgi:hypothetical protein